MIAAILLCGRPEFERCALAQVRAQKEKHLEIVVRGISGVSRARNVGLAKARKLGADAVAFFDDDDLYSAHYLSSVVNGLREAQIVGRPEHYLFDASKGSYYLMGPGCPPDEVFAAPGGTLGFRLDGALGFYEKLAWCEDFDWCLRMRDRGATFRTLPPSHYMKRQFQSGHTYPMSVEALTVGAKKLKGEPDWRSA